MQVIRTWRLRMNKITVDFDVPKSKLKTFNLWLLECPKGIDYESNMV